MGGSAIFFGQLARPLGRNYGKQVVSCLVDSCLVEFASPIRSEGRKLLAVVPRQQDHIHGTVMTGKAPLGSNRFFLDLAKDSFEGLPAPDDLRVTWVPCQC